MASGDTTTYDTTVKPSGPPSDNKGSIGPVVDVGLRFLLFVSALVAVIVMVTSKQTKMITLGPVSIPFVAKFTQSPAFVYFVAALSVTCLHSILTGLISVLVLIKPAGGLATKLQFHFVILDALLLGIVAAATGAAGGVGYIGFKGNSHTQWQKVCDHFGSFCDHFAASIFLSLISAITLLLLVWRSVYVLSKNISRP